MSSGDAWEQFAGLAKSPDEELDVARAALLIATTEYPRLDIEGELAVLDSLAAGAARRFGEDRSPLAALNTLSEYLFDEVGFRGNTEDYYDPRNSYLNDVLGRRLGIPITLSLVYIEVGKRLEIPILGVGMPGHFLARHRDEDALFIDPFNGGLLLSETECAARLNEVAQSQIEWDPGYLAPISSREFIARMLGNLKTSHLGRKDYARGLTMIDWIMTILPEATDELRDRGLVHYELGQHAEALDDLTRCLESNPDFPGADNVRTLIARLQRMVGEG